MGQLSFDQIKKIGEKKLLMYAKIARLNENIRNTRLKDVHEAIESLPLSSELRLEFLAEATTLQFAPNRPVFQPPPKSSEA